MRHGARVKKYTCSHEVCSNQSVKGGVCIRHGAEKKICSHEGCTKYAQVGGVCRRHGAKRKLSSHEGCINYAQKGHQIPPMPEIPGDGDMAMEGNQNGTDTMIIGTDEVNQGGSGSGGGYPNDEVHFNNKNDDMSVEKGAEEDNFRDKEATLGIHNLGNTLSEVDERVVETTLNNDDDDHNDEKMPRGDNHNITKLQDSEVQTVEKGLSSNVDETTHPDLLKIVNEKKELERQLEAAKAKINRQDAKLKASDEEKMKLEKTVEAAKKEVSEADKKVKAAEEEKQMFRDAALELIACPVCEEVKKERYVISACRHPICLECGIRVDTCPTCRESVQEKIKISTPLTRIYPSPPDCLLGSK